MTGGDDRRPASGVTRILVTAIAWSAALALLVGSAWLLSQGIRSIAATMQVAVGKKVLVRFAPPARPAPPETVPSSAEPDAPPRWYARPMPDYPLTAVADGVEEGRVVLSCTVLTTGRLSDCAVLSEDPAGHGFGKAALDATRDARVQPRRVDGEDVDAKIQFAVAFRMTG